MVNMFLLQQNVLQIKIALAHRTYATLADVTVVTKKRSALEGPIHVQLDNANAVHLMNVRLKKRVIMENARVRVIN